MPTFIDSGVSPACEIACDPISDLEITGNTVYCTNEVGGTGAVSVTVTQTSQKYRGLWIRNDAENAEWKQVDYFSIRLSDSKSDPENGKYRVKSVLTLIDKNGESEKITIYSDEKTVG